MRYAIRFMIVMLIGSMLVGCSTIRHGGAPEPSFDIDKDLEELSKEFSPSTSISKFFENPSKEARDKFVTGRLTLINIRYIQFIRQLTAERQLLDSAAGMLELGLNLAGTAVAAAGTKTILSAIAAGVTGSKEIVDKNYFFEKTIPALVGQMNAERKKAVVPILRGMKGDLSDYPFGQAVTDIHNYYQAGTFTGAIQAIQAEAGAKEQRQDDAIATIQPLPPDVKKTKEALTRAIGDLREGDIERIRTVVRMLAPNLEPATTLDAAKNQLQGLVRGARTVERVADVERAYRSAGIHLPE